MAQMPGFFKIRIFRVLLCSSLLWDIAERASPPPAGVAPVWAARRWLRFIDGAIQLGSLRLSQTPHAVSRKGRLSPADPHASPLPRRSLIPTPKSDARYAPSKAGARSQSRSARPATPPAHVESPSRFGHQP